MAVNRSLLDKVLRGLRPVIILLAVLSITAVVLNWLRLEAELQTYRQDAVDNIHWNVSQLELDLVRFGSEAEILQLKPDESLGELRKRFDLFYSRAQSILQGNMFGKLNLGEAIVPMNARLEYYLAQTTPLVDAPDVDLRAALPQIEVDANIMREDLRAMSVKLVKNYAVMADMRRAVVATMVQRAAWAAWVVILALATLSLLVL